MAANLTLTEPPDLFINNLEKEIKEAIDQDVLSSDDLGPMADILSFLYDLDTINRQCLIRLLAVYHLRQSGILYSTLSLN